MNIAIQLGGERIYVLPVAWDNQFRGLNKVFYFDSPDFAPYPNDLLIENRESTSWLYLQKSRYIWYKYAKRLFVTIGRQIKMAAKYHISPFFMFGWRYQTSVPFIGYEVYPHDFSIPHHPMIVQSPHEYYTDDYYLNPSQQFLERELQKVLEAEPDSDFLNWRERMFAQGFKVNYIASLDT